MTNGMPGNWQPGWVFFFRSPFIQYDPWIQLCFIGLNLHLTGYGILFCQFRCFHYLKLMNKQKIMRLAMGFWSNGKENLDTGWEMLAKVQVSFLQPWEQCEIGKKNPWNETCGCPLLLKVINQGYSSGSWRGWASPQYLSKVLVGHKHLLQWSLAEVTGILCCCPEWAGHHFQWVLSRWSCFSPTGTKGRWNLTLPCPLQAFVPFQSHQNKGAVVPLLGSP